MPTCAGYPPPSPSRPCANRDAFAARAVAELSLPGSAAGSAGEAVAGADLVVLATRSDNPVIDAGDVGPGAHVITVGPKTLAGHELPLGLVERAAVVTCDAPQQASRHGEARFITAERERVHLGAGPRSAPSVAMHTTKLSRHGPRAPAPVSGTVPALSTRGAPGLDSGMVRRVAQKRAMTTR